MLIKQATGPCRLSAEWDDDENSISILIDDVDDDDDGDNDDDDNDDNDDGQNVRSHFSHKLRLGF